MAQQEWAAPKIEAVSEQVINLHLKKFKITGMAKKQIEEKIAAITKHMETVQEKDGGGVADCTTCGGDSYLEVDVCPFCGDGEIDEDGIPEAAPEEATPKKVTKKVTKKVVSKTAAKEALKEPEVRKRRAMKKKKRTSTALATKTEIAIVSTKELDDAVKKVKKLGSDTAVKMYQLGVALFEIYDTELWKQRTKGDGGASIYKNWKQFCKAEFGMTAKHAYSLMDVSKAFTEDEVKEIGTTKLAIALKVPDEHRERLVASAAEGASVRELQDQVAKTNGKKPAVVDTEGSEVPESSPTTAPAPKAPKKGITVAYEKLRVEIPLFKKLAANAKADAQPKPAKTIKDCPYAEEISNNGEICTRYSVVVNDSGELTLNIERRKL